MGQIFVNVIALVMVGVSVGLHFGPIDGIAAALALHALMPYPVRP